MRGLANDGIYLRVRLSRLTNLKLGPFQTGIGTLWDDKKVSGTDAERCPYRGARANAEYEAISGCATVPAETGGKSGDGTFCSHWSETCLKNELMTGFIGPRNPLSRITIGTLEDLGYTVDYTVADSFGRADLGPGCACTRRRSLVDAYLGVTRQLGLGSPANKPRRLSDASYQIAVDYGRAILAERAQPSFFQGLPIVNDDVVYVGDQIISVIVQDGADGIFEVLVQPAI